jgi:hypothetical protein
VQGVVIGRQHADSRAERQGWCNCRIGKGMLWKGTRTARSRAVVIVCCSAGNVLRGKVGITAGIVEQCKVIIIVSLGSEE